MLLSAAWLGQIGPLLAQDGVGIAFDDLSREPTHTTVDRFSVQLSNLDAATTYTVVVASDNATALGIGGCGTASQAQTVTGVTAQDLAFVVYACALGSSTLTAEVRASGADSAAATVRQALTVLAIPEGAPPGVPGAAAASAGTRGATKAGTPGIVPNVRFDTITSTSARARWDTPSNGGRDLTGFGLLLWTGPNHPDYGDAFVVGAASRSHTYTGLQSGATYKFRIHACNDPDSCGHWTHPPKEVRIPPAPTATPTPTPTPTRAATTAPPATTPGPVRNLTHTGSGKHTVSVSWQAPSSSGSAALTGYQVQHKTEGTRDWPEGSDVVTPGSTTAWTIRGLINGTRYAVRVRACNAAPACGTWVELTGSATAGHKVGNASLIPSSANLTIGQRQSFAIHDIPVGKTARTYLVGPIQPEGRCRTSGASAQGRGPSTGSGYYDSLRIEGCAPGGTGWLRVVNADESELYASAKIIVQAAGTEPGPGDPPSTEPGEPTPIEGCGSVAPGALVKPRDLDVIPYSQRRALLTWVGSEAATHYSVRITRVDTSTSVTGRVENRPCWQINLDNILGLNSPQGLAHATAFQFEVTAQVIAPDGTVSNSEGPSETVTLIDNPILSINGNSKGTSDGKGQAVVRWSKITGATNYTIMYRELPGDHTKPGWTVEPRPASPRRGSISMAASSAAVDPSDSTVLTHTIGGTTNTPNRLERRNLYAVSVNYRKGSDRYFAASEAFVWPSDAPADGGQRLATFPLVHRLTNKTYSYHICDETFVPAGTLNVRRDSWVTLVTKAIEHWDSATQNLVTVERVAEPCRNFDTEISQLEGDIRLYLVHLGLDPDNLPESLNLLNSAQLRLYARSLMMLLKETGAVRGLNDESVMQNEIYMFNDVEGSNKLFISAYVFGEIAPGIGYRCWVDINGNFDKSAAMCTQSDPIAVQDVNGNQRTEWRSDIVVRRSAYDKSNHLVAWGRSSADDPLLVPASNARFNTCKSTAGSVSADDEGSAYATMVHEAGHALGIGGGSSNEWVQSGHPQVSDSVMNYDYIAVAKEPSVPPVRRGDFDPRFRERDCGPHPLDLMAIYALYQTDR